MTKTQKFRLEDVAFDGELGAALDTDPHNLGWPQAGHIKMAIKELKSAVGESGAVTVSVDAAGGFTQVEVTPG